MRLPDRQPWYANPVGAVLTNTALITGTYRETNTANNSATAVVLNTAAAVYLPLIWK